MESPPGSTKNTFGSIQLSPDNIKKPLGFKALGLFLCLNESVLKRVQPRVDVHSDVHAGHVSTWTRDKKRLKAKPSKGFSVLLPHFAKKIIQLLRTTLPNKSRAPPSLPSSYSTE